MSSPPWGATRWLVKAVNSVILPDSWHLFLFADGDTLLDPQSQQFSFR